MRAVVLGLAWMSLLTAVTSAQEVVAPFFETTPVEGAFAEAPDPSKHAGLLGKLFMQEQYIEFKIDDPVFERIDPDAQGFSTLINIPLATMNTTEAIDVDLFFGYGQLSNRGGATFGPPINETVRLNSRTDQYTLGVSLYPTYADKFRPFVQLGLVHTRDEMDALIGAIVVTDDDRQTEALVNLGLEADLLPSLAYRGRFNVETQDSFDDSSFSSELILWLHDRVYMRGGFLKPLNGDGLGWSLGGGIAF